MVLSRKLLAVLLGAIALVVAVHFVASPFYEEWVDAGLVWDVVNWFMAVAVMVALVVHFIRKAVLGRRQADGAVTLEYLEINLLFYATVLLALWFFWNWVDNLTVGADPQGDTHLLIWALVDPLFVLIVGVTARRLWRGPPPS